MVSYRNTKIYKVVCRTTNKVYISHTTKRYLSQRLSYHAQKYQKYLMGQCVFNPVFRIIENNDYYIELIEICRCDSKDEVLRKQNEFIASMDCLNKQVVFLNIMPQ
jgi:hypothetical protein